MSVMGLSGNRRVPTSPRHVHPLRVFLSLFLVLVAHVAQAHAFEPEKGVSRVLPDAEVRLECDQFGVGDTSRRGEWVGIRLVLTDTSSKPRDVLVRISSTDADGDRPVEQREVTLNPGVAQSVWMYLKLPFNYTAGEGLIASVSEALEGGTAPDGGRGYRSGALLARATLAPNSQSVQNSSQGMIGVIGERVLGLTPYNGLSLNLTGFQGQNWHPYLHENTMLVNGLSGSQMPDRWMGLTQFDAILWAKGDPGELRGDKAAAVREWVQRGGHLVVVLPAVGQNWTNEKLNELIDIMPRVSVGLRENVDLSDFRPLLIGTPRPLFPKTGTIHVFKPAPDASVDEAAPILNSPKGECVVVRRTVGTGAVTFIGLDINATGFSQADSIDADVFWHRVLGRRGLLARTAQAGKGGLAVSRAAWFVDRGLGELINQSGRTALGLLAALVVFVLYWALAGPAGFLGLKAKGWQRHAWVAFLAATGVFTAVAWGGATLLRPQRIEARHVTILDHVYGQARERARMFASVLIPSYGDARLGITPDAGSVAIAPWEPPLDEVSTWAGFPDARSYLIDTRDPASILVPTRATVKQVQLDWSGGPRWSMPIPQAPGGGQGVISLDPTGGGSSGKPLVNGVLVHNLPGTLRQVKIVVIRGQTNLNPVRRRRSELFDNFPLAQGEAFDLSEWAPQTPLDLGVQTAPLTRAESRQLPIWLNGLLPASVGNGLSNDDSGDFARTFEERMRALTFIGQLKPMEGAGDNSLSNAPAAQRLCTHGYDLSRWFTQPCVIIIGFLGDERGEAPSPVPLTVDGREVKTIGRTMVRWVYPLPANPPSYPSETETTSGPGEAGPANEPRNADEGEQAPGPQ